MVETCEVSFDESVPCTTPIIELSGDDEVGTSIFEDDEDVNGAGDAGALRWLQLLPLLLQAPMMMVDWFPLPPLCFSKPKLEQRMAPRVK